jgi:CheY-like chemotaxis protein
MPNTNGWDILALIREYDPTHNIAVIAMTAYHSDKLAERVYAGGFDDYFPKPIDLTEFSISSSSYNRLRNEAGNPIAHRA